MLPDFDADLGQLSDSFQDIGNPHINMLSCLYTSYIGVLLRILKLISDRILITMDLLNIFIFSLVCFVFVLSLKILKIFFGLSSASGHSNIVIGLHLQLNCSRDGDP